MPVTRVLPLSHRLVLTASSAALVASAALAVAVATASAASADPAGLAPGTIVTTSMLTDSLRLIAPDGTRRDAGSDLSAAPDPGGIATDASGDVFAVGSFLDRIVEITPGGEQHYLDLGSAGGGPARLGDVAIGPDGTAFVTEPRLERIVALAPDESTRVVASGFAPGGVATDAAGNLYATDPAGARVVEIGPAGTVTTLATGFTAPSDLAVGATGTVYVVDDGAVIELGADGSRESVPGAYASQLALDAAGNLFTSHGYGDLEEFPADGSAPRVPLRNPDDDFFGALAVFGTAPVPSAQAIDWTATLPDSPVIGDVADVSVAGTAVTFSVDATSTPGACALTPTGDTTASVRFTGPGSCVVDADRAGSPAYTGQNLLAAPTARDAVVVAKRSQTLGFATVAPSPARVGDTYYPWVNGGASGNPVVLSVGGSGACALTGNTTVTFQRRGTCVLIANQAGDDIDAAAAPVTQRIVVARRAQRITFPPVGAMTSPSARVLSATTDSGLPVRYYSETPAVCIVGLGVLHAKTAGTCTVVARAPITAEYAPAPQVSRTVVVRH